VLFPALSRLSALRDDSGFAETCTRGLILNLAITVPAAAGLAFLAEPVVALLFQWGRFGSAEVIAVAPVVAISAWSIPLFSVVAFLTRIFHARQEMGIPVKISAWSVAINLTLSVCLMIPFGVQGLAWATVLTAGVQSGWLAAGLRKMQFGPCFPQVASAMARIGVSSVFLGLLLAGILHLWQWDAGAGDRMETALLVGLSITSGIIAFAGVAWLTGLHRVFLPRGYGGRTGE
jgi:putative peptidoglycan lipid II flippase